MIIRQKLSPPSEFIRLRQKGIFLFSVLILGFLGFHFWEKNQKPTLSEKVMKETDVTIELDGKVHRPSLLVYSQPSTVQQVIGDGGGFRGEHSLSAAEGKDVLIQDAALMIESGKNGKIYIQQKTLSVKALYILGRPIPLNRARAEDLDRLPGIGPGLAQRIVEYRQALGKFSSLGQLKEVKGIKEKTFEKIKGYLTL
jgi:competence protein ComEA